MAPQKAIKSKLEKFSDWWKRKTKKIILPGLEGLSLYNLWIIYWGGIVRGTFSTRASSIAFSFFMAIFPFLLFILNLIPYITFIDDFQIQFLLFMDNLLPPETSDFFGTIFEDIANTPRGGLLSVAFFLSIFLMTNGINAIFTGFEFSYHTKNNRSIPRQYAVAVGVSLILALLLLISVIGAVYITYALEDLSDIGLVNSDGFGANLIKYIGFIILIYTAVAILYYFGTREARQARFFSVGALFTTILIMITTFLFSLYITNFSNYNELYGSIGALLILMFYIWLNSNMLLLGFELNASLIKLKKNYK
ncbi:YihY/virulence factor BrkB family protein [Pontixanthobacter gangjinensis]|uniref:YihY/virulence factor BrkB family protein n=1 Tax=Christiangramia aestuarii TaxID=1028746 RepID=A0A7K1LPA7_9FLAO|nr:YihY/virulence factor BrkB family protein [Christiangramia aestuarii]MUP42627.1 YihY/virulence factor BrkB family protein [Christiangramia aestuarii]